MRIIAGELGGRRFAAPHGSRTHPMSDKMRGALFNMLGDISGESLLDAFSGSGALSFEAISRGAGGAVAIEQDRSAQRTIAENIVSLQLGDAVKLIKAGVGSWLRTNTETFDVVLMDPPYDALQMTLLVQLVQRAKPGGTVVLSWPGKQLPPEFEQCDLRTSKSYGDGSLHVYDVR